MTVLTIDPPNGTPYGIPGGTPDGTPVAGEGAFAGTAAAPDLPPVSASVGFGWWDVGAVGLVMVLATGYLYQRLWRRRGRCDGCARGDRPCAIERLQGPAGRQPDGSVLVPLTGLRRR